MIDYPPITGTRKPGDNRYFSAKAVEILGSAKSYFVMREDVSGRRSAP
jgi:hypothetical protein